MTWWSMMPNFVFYQIGVYALMITPTKSHQISRATDKAVTKGKTSKFLSETYMLWPIIRNVSLTYGFVEK